MEDPDVSSRSTEFLSRPERVGGVFVGLLHFYLDYFYDLDTFYNLTLYYLGDLLLDLGDLRLFLFLLSKGSLCFTLMGLVGNGKGQFLSYYAQCGQLYSYSRLTNAFTYYGCGEVATIRRRDLVIILIIYISDLGWF